MACSVTSTDFEPDTVLLCHSGQRASGRWGGALQAGRGGAEQLARRGAMHAERYRAVTKVPFRHGETS